MATKTHHPRRMLSSSGHPRSGPPAARAPHKRHRRRNASIKAPTVGQNLTSSTLPAIGAGALVGVLALQAARRMHVPAGAVAATTAALGTVGTLVTRPGVLQSVSAGVAGVGAALGAIEVFQKRTTPQAQAAHAGKAASKTAVEAERAMEKGAQRFASPEREMNQGAESARQGPAYVTREDMQAAVKRALAEERNAPGDSAPAWAPESEREAWHDVERDAQPIEVIDHSGEPEEEEVYVVDHAEGAGMRNDAGEIEAWHLVQDEAA